MKKLLSIALIAAMIVSVTPLTEINLGSSNSGLVYAAEVIPIDEEHFPDAGFRGYLTSAFGSSFSPTSVTVLDLSKLGITSLEGIQYFTALKDLNCSYCNLSSLDVSHNTALEALYCSNNKLSSLDVSNNTALKYLNCGSNNLSSLDVSHNTALVDLDCSFNYHLSSLDVSHNDALWDLTCYNNDNLVKLYVGKESPVYCRCDDGVEIIHVGGTNIIPIDEDHFPDAAFRAYLIEKYGSSFNPTKVIELCITGVPVESLEGIQYFTALKDLNCSYCNLSNLDISHNTALESLNCCSSNLSSLDVSNNTALKYLECGHNNLSSLDVSNNTVLEKLYCYDNNLSSLDIRRNTALKDLDCGSNNLSSLDVSYNTELVTLDCYSNNLNSLNVNYLADLKSLWCSDNKLSSLDVSHNTALSYLSCTQNNLGKLYVGKELPVSCYYDDGVEIIIIQEEILEGHIKYYYYLDNNEDKTSTTDSVYYSDSFFSRSNNEYDHEIATASLAMGMSGFSKDFIEIFLKNCGFKQNLEQSIRYDIDKKDDQDKVAYTFATKKIAGKTVIAVSLRGGEYGNEWGSNGRVGYLGKALGYHYAFNKAADDVKMHLEEYCGKNGIVLQNAKIWLTGYSRSAAVANCVGEKLEREGLIDKSNLYCYGFATPRTVTERQVDTNVQGIFNIVNPLDIVPCVPLNSSTVASIISVFSSSRTVNMDISEPWSYTRHGDTLELPSYLGTSSYNKKLGEMRDQFDLLTENQNNYERMNGVTLQLLLDILSSTTATENFYVKQLQDQIIVPGLEQLAGEGVTSDAAIIGLISEIPGARLLLREKGFDYQFKKGDTTSNSVQKRAAIPGLSLTMQHWPETYMAWMKTGYEPKKASSFKSIFVQCPVDIEVYDPDNELVARITNDTIDESIEPHLESYVDETGAKMIFLPSDAEFNIKLIATDDGTMTYSVREFDGDRAFKRKTIFEDIEIENGQVFTGNVNGELNTDSDNYALESNGEIISADYDLSDEALNNIEIKADIVGDGIVMGEGLYTIGDSVVLDASPLYDNEFIGWYTENDELITNESVITTVAKEAITYKAKFTEADVTPEDPTPVDPQPAPVVTPTTPAVTAPAEIQDLPSVKISKPAAAKKSVNVKWKKVSKKNQKNIQGIEIQVATDSGFTDIVKTATAGKKKTSKKIKGLTAKQTYYVRIRAYKDAADGRHVSAWKAKKVKVK